MLISGLIEQPECTGFAYIYIITFSALKLIVINIVLFDFRLLPIDITYHLLSKHHYQKIQMMLTKVKHL